MSDYTPTTEVVKDAVTFPRRRLGEPRDMTPEAFDRWLNAERARIWDEGFSTDIYAPDYKGNPYRSTP